MARRQDVTAYQGDDFYALIQGNGGTYDWTGWTGFAAQVRHYPDSTTVLATLAVTLVQNATTNLWEPQVFLAAATTQTLTPGRHCWDCHAITPTGQPWSPVTTSSFSVQGDTTR